MQVFGHEPPIPQGDALIGIVEVEEGVVSVFKYLLAGVFIDQGAITSQL